MEPLRGQETPLDNPFVLEAIALAALRKWLTADSFARLFVFGPSELEDAGKALIEFESRHGYKPETKTA